jgi:hypothetical protein
LLLTSCIEIEKTPHWGVPEPRGSLLSDALDFKSPAYSPAAATIGQISPILYPPPPLNVPRINKERFLKRRVAPPKAMQYNEWQAENNRLDALQRNSYHTDQSVIEPGQQPAPPIFGPSRQNVLSVGSNMPEPYLWGTTPSDFARKAEECQALRNSCLERMHRCQICAVTFPEYEKEKIAEHLKSHQDALRESGKCPLCDCCWAALDKEQKKQHLWNHQDQGEHDLITNFWQGFQCPICNLDLQSLPNEDILAHMADHPPGLLRFCDRCGLDIQSCFGPERFHHEQACQETETAERIIYCLRCGKDRSHETEIDRQIHDRLCTSNRRFCTKCGLDMTRLSIDEANRHGFLCKPPSGARKTFCKRCGKNLVAMDARSRATHKQECYMREPYIDPRERLEGQLFPIIRI